MSTHPTPASNPSRYIGLYMAIGISLVFPVPVGSPQFTPGEPPYGAVRATFWIWIIQLVEDT